MEMLTDEELLKRKIEIQENNKSLEEFIKRMKENPKEKRVQLNCFDLCHLNDVLLRMGDDPEVVEAREKVKSHLLYFVKGLVYASESENLK